MTDQIRRLVDISTGQHGAIAPHQAALMGVSPRQLRRRVQSGILSRSGTHVVRSPFIASTPVADFAAFVLDCGAGALVCGPSAAALHGFDGMVLEPPFHVVIPRGRSVHRSGHHLHTSKDLPPIDHTRVAGIPVLAAPRTLIDVARWLRPAALTVALDSALRDQQVTEAQLHGRIAALRSSGRNGIPKLLGVIEGGEITRGAHSWLERRFLELCADAGLPQPRTQVVLAEARANIVRVDFEFPGTDVVVEVLGYRHHRGSRAQLARDAERINAMVIHGKRPLQFTYDHITLEGGWVTDQVIEALGPAA